MADSISYRPHIDGLRAVAVLSVVFFHLKIFPLSGGFTGVDIFFTISGFLISKIIFATCADGSFSFLNFYAHRARRILPALLVVTALTLTAGLLFLYPFEYLRLTRSFVAALAFCANIYFYETADYFAAGASDLPLLHLWSLGIEEQFYLAFPVIVLALFRFRRDLLPNALGLILLASLVAAQVQLGNDPTASFYLLPYRAWELLAGSLLALPQRHHTSNVAVARTAGSVGLLLIGWSVFFLDTGMSFPGLNALPACIGAALVIWSGESAVTLPIRLLSIPPIVYVGKLSYSLYLYHWPLLFFAKRLFPDAPYNSAIVLIASFVLSALSYHFVEQPARHIRVSSLRTLFAAGAGMTAAMLAGFAVLTASGLARSGNPKIAHALSFLDYRNDRQFGTCYLRESSPFSALPADCLAPSTNPVAVIWGDSGMAMYASQLAKAFAASGYTMRQMTASACPPTIDLNFSARPYCHDINKTTLEKIIALKPAMVVLGAGWPTIKAVEVYDHLEETISALQNAGLKVVVMGPGPRYNFEVPRILADRYSGGRSDDRSGPDLRRDWVFPPDDEVRARVGNHPPAKYVSILKAVCPDGECPLLIGDVPVHFDAFHVTEEGAALFVSKFAGQIFDAETANKISVH